MARKILLADDSVTAQNMGRKILADAGYEVLTVNNGSAALKKIAEQKPDLIILDVYMPGYSGLEVCLRLKEAVDTARLPVLLTVGKLEPFKPEEAKRARADAFIVKPFEASELLSALSKLEDKIVPRAEPSKTGRFARAAATIDDSERNTSSQGDSGWKNRIGFPRKKEKSEEETDNQALYNAVNKDLRTVVDREPAKPSDADESRKPEAGRPAERWIDVGTSGLPGLPADVTAEEIAGLAAAMAQVQATLTAKESVGIGSPAAAQAPGPAAIEESRPTETGEKTEAHAESAPAPVPAPVAEASLVATFAEQQATESPRGEHPATDLPLENLSGIPTAPLPHSDLIAAIASLEPVNGQNWDGARSGNGAGQPSAQFASESSEVPATMAGSRWTAVPVALNAGENAISLENEMQQAYAAFAAAEATHRQSEGASSAAESASSSQAPAVEQAAPVVPSHAEEELAMALSAVAHAAPEAVSPFASELASVAAPTEATAHIAAESELFSSSQSIAAPDISPQNAQALGQQETAAHTPEIVPAPEVVESIAPTPVGYEQAAHAIEAPTREGSDVSVATDQPSASEPSFIPEPVAASSEPAPTASDSLPETKEQTPQRHEPDLATATAAAWANWRQIRNSRETQEAEPARGGQKEIEEGESSRPHDAAAMAVAAGAENSPEEVASAGLGDTTIANIVDSVLADLRPKIVEEISRKLKKK